MFGFEGENIELDFDNLDKFDLVVRDKMTPGNGAQVSYIPISAVLSGTNAFVDSALPPIELSSIQTGSWTDPDTQEEHKYHQLFNFQAEGKTIDYSSIGCYNIVLRDYEEHPSGAVVSYTPLSDLAFRPDSSGASGQKSTSFLSGTRDLQLWRFDEAGETDTSALVPTYFDGPAYVLSDELEFVLRRGGAGGEIEYRKLLLKQDALSVDKQGNPNQKSLQYCNLGNGTFLELDHFHSDGTTSPKVVLASVDTSLLPENQEFVIRKKVGSFWQIDYTPLSACLSGVLSGATQVDSEIPRLQLSSIQTKDDGTQSYHQLFNFQAEATQGCDTWLKFQDQPFPGEDLNGEDFSIGCQTQFVVRVPSGNGYEVKYMKLSAYQEHERVDTRTRLPKGRSVDYTAYDEGWGCYDVLELYGFDWGYSQFTTSSDISSQHGNGILTRKWDDVGCFWFLDYMSFDSLDELAVKYIGDS